MTASDARKRLAALNDPHAGCIPRFCRAGSGPGVVRCDEAAETRQYAFTYGGAA